MYGFSLIYDKPYFTINSKYTREDVDDTYFDRIYCIRLLQLSVSYSNQFTILSNLFMTLQIT